MGLEISKITNEALKAFAQGFDTDNVKGNLSAEEFAIFATKGSEAEAKGISKEDFSQALGLYKAEESTSTTTTPTELKGDKKFTQKEAKNFIFRKMDILLKEGCTKDNLMAELDACLGDNVSNEAFVKVKEQISAVIECMPEYESIADITKKRQEAKRNLASAGIRDAEHERILLKLEKFAKNQVVKTAYEDIGERHGTISAENEDQTDEVTMGQIKSDLKSEKNFNLEERKAFKAYEKLVIMPKANELVRETVKDNTEDTKWREVRKEAIETLKSDEKYDKYAKRAMKSKYGDVNSGYVAHGKVVSKKQATANRVEDKKTNQTEKEFLKAIKNNKDLYIALDNQGLVDEKDGKLDITNLSGIVREHTGADNTLNKNHRKYDAESEVTLLKVRLQRDLGLEDISESEVKTLVKACGYKVDSPEAKAALLGALGGTAIGSLVGLTSLALTPCREALIKGASIYIDDTESVKVFGAKIEQVLKGEIKLGDVYVRMPKDVATTMWPSALLGIAFGLAQGLADAGLEPPVIPTDMPLEDSVEEYLEGVKLLFKDTKAKGYYNVVSCLAHSFVDPETQEWDKVGYHKALTNLAGWGSPLNRDELVEGCVIPPETKKPEEKVEEHTYCTRETPAVEETREVLPVPVIDGSSTTWKQIALRYPCLVDKYGIGGAISIIKIVQAITDGDYSEKRIEELYNKSRSISKQGLSVMKDIPGFDYKTYENLYYANVLPRLIVKDGKPDEGTGVKVPTKIAECDYDKTVPLDVKVTNFAKATVRALGHAVDYITKAGSKGRYDLRIDDGDWKTYDTQELREAAIKDYQEQYKKLTRKENCDCEE